jgi:hypothetical protein
VRLHFGLHREGQSVPKLESYHDAILEPRELIKQVSDWSLQFEFIGAKGARAPALSAKSRDTHHFHIPI